MHQSENKVEGDLPTDEAGYPDTAPYWENKNDPAWPTHCACGYAFTHEDRYSSGAETLYRRTDTGEILRLRDAPPGAMWFAQYLDFDGSKHWEERGKGAHLLVKTPAGEWDIDAKSSNGSGWTREGTPPNVTASPSISIGKPERYHGWLRNGQLVKA